MSFFSSLWSSQGMFWCIHGTECLRSGASWILCPWPMTVIGGGHFSAFLLSFASSQAKSRATQEGWRLAIRERVFSFHAYWSLFWIWKECLSHCTYTCLTILASPYFPQFHVPFWDSKTIQGSMSMKMFVVWIQSAQAENGWKTHFCRFFTWVLHSKADYYPETWVGGTKTALVAFLHDRCTANYHPETWVEGTETAFGVDTQCPVKLALNDQEQLKKRHKAEPEFKWEMVHPLHVLLWWIRGIATCLLASDKQEELQERKSHIAQPRASVKALQYHVLLYRVGIGEARRASKRKW